MSTEHDGPITLFTRHVIVPAAIIAMVTAFLFYLLEVRSVFLGGGAAFKQVGLCFSVATVLIARYGRVSGAGDSQGCYTVALALATLLFMLTRSSGASFVPNVLIIAAVWRFATGVTRALSLEGELDPRPKEHRLYGLERLRFEAFRRRQQIEKGPAWGTGRSLRQKPDAHGNPVAAVARLAALALLGFAIGEPFLLRAAPEVAERALADVIVFLFATGLVLAAGSAAGTLRHTLWQGGRVSPGVLPTRLGLAALLAVAVLAAALAIPGVHFKGQGRLRSTNQPGKTGSGENQSDGRRSSNAKSNTPDAQQPRGSRQAPQQPVPDADDAGDGGEAIQAAATLVNALSGLGKLLRIPLLLGIPILILFALLRLGPLLPRWSDLLARLRNWLSRLLPERKPKPAPVTDPFADLGRLNALPPREAVLAAYARLLAALDQAGHSRPEKATPYEHLAALPARLKPLAAPARQVTDLYVVTAYGDGEPTAADREQAVSALAEIQGLLLRDRAA